VENKKFHSILHQKPRPKGSAWRHEIV